MHVASRKHLAEWRSLVRRARRDSSFTPSSAQINLQVFIVLPEQKPLFQGLRSETIGHIKRYPLHAAATLGCMLQNLRPGFPVEHLANHQWRLPCQGCVPDAASRLPHREWAFVS